MRKGEGKARNLISVDNADIRLIKIFLRLVEAGGLSAAQAELNLSLSTISGKISALEERLGVTSWRVLKSGPCDGTLPVKPAR